MPTPSENLNSFNTQYQQYIKCNSGNSLPPCSADITTNCCDISLYTRDTADTTGNIRATMVSITDLQSKVLTDLDLSGNSMYSTFQSNEKIRADLDKKLKELYKLDGSNVNDQASRYDSVMYTSILFTILATMILYFTFTYL
jgi:hypothetical protein